MAWEGVLCGWYGSKGDNWAYGFTSNLEGDFTWSGVQVRAGGGQVLRQSSSCTGCGWPPAR